MADKHIIDQHHQTFESIRQFDIDGSEFWLARDLQPLLDYAAWDKFSRVLDKAMEACRQSGHDVGHHFSQVVKLVEIGSGARREIEDFRLSRYACYLTVQNGDPAKPVIANGQTEVGQKVHQIIADLGGTMPEALPAPEANIRQHEKGKKKLEKKQ